MPWKKTTAKKIATDLGIDIDEVRAKQHLMGLIRELRIKRKLTQAEFAKILGVSQGRVAQIESGIGTARLTYDVLFNALKALGYGCKLSPYPQRGISISA